MKVILVFLFFCFLFRISFSQRIPNQYKKYFKNCCNPKKTTIRSLIDIDGYYSLGIVYSNNKGSLKVDTFFAKILFYEDGFNVSAWGGYDGFSDSEYLAQVVKNGDQDFFYKNAFWGQYEIRNDSIIIRSILFGTFMRKVAVEEDIYKVVDRKTIRLVSHKDLTDKKNNQNGVLNIKYVDGIFTDANIIPLNKYSWLRRQKCVDCN
ncbi:MAG: hypothetical protein QM535_21045 [Limnohabitans sp.]|nr:hypothetical protein [Limnohabitans sp.]